MAREIRFFAGLWTLLEYPAPDRGWTLERKIEAVKDGFAAPESVG